MENNNNNLLMDPGTCRVQMYSSTVDVSDLCGSALSMRCVNHGVLSEGGGDRSKYHVPGRDSGFVEAKMRSVPARNLDDHHHGSMWP